MRYALPCEIGCEFDELCAACGNGNYVLKVDYLPAYRKGDICFGCNGTGITMQTAVDDERGYAHVQVNGTWTPVDSISLDYNPDTKKYTIQEAPSDDHRQAS